MALSGRLKGLRGLLRAVDGFLVTDITNVRYLTGFRGSAGFVLITRNGGVFVTDFRYAEQAEREVGGFRVEVEKKGGPLAVRAVAGRLGLRTLGVEDSISCGFYTGLEAGGLRLRASRDAVLKARAVKDEEEIDAIREAVRRAEAAFGDVKTYVKVGEREDEIALRLEERLRRNGCRRIPFDVIVSSGPNSSMPHASPTDRRLAPGDLLIIDWGGEADGYFSDMSRTFLLSGGEMGRKKEIYGLVLEANRRGIASVKAGAEAARIDNSARDVIKKAGYGRCFGHALGHGVGLEVHEMPRISPDRRTRIREGMVFTIEPGVYVPGLGGVRIEEMVVARPGGAEVLTSLPVELEIL